jgi:uncharacterized protein
MKILIDADGCPVVDCTIACARQTGIDVLLICDAAHYFERDGARTITVVKGADSVDFKLVNLIDPGDLVITQDYGLAAMSLAKQARVLNQNGMEYTNNNIDALLMARHTALKIRRGGGRLKGPAKRTRVQDDDFRAALLAMLNPMM